MIDQRVRVWSRYLDRMYYSESIDGSDGVSIGYDNGFVFKRFDPCIAWTESCEVVEAEVGRVESDAVFMNCVGRDDVNGRTMYEGDIVENPSGRRCIITTFNSCQFVGFDLRALNGDGKPSTVELMWDEQTVIGNVFENCELVEGINVSDILNGAW